ncbi:hypothetical protein KDI_56040 [Dictyobacter arantiisoli]|uniref:Uncharacterized protein n=1 Tax=Dictyobacter arantiisoli TaxID=2014874 RepID=A0A5A5TK88_9CHLR|nr:hypothetical protein KDI_56040 [Dictyobacter arantiisoli]
MRRAKTDLCAGQIRSDQRESGKNACDEKIPGVFYESSRIFGEPVKPPINEMKEFQELQALGKNGLLVYTVGD